MADKLVPRLCACATAGLPQVDSWDSCHRCSAIDAPGAPYLITAGGAAEAAISILAAVQILVTAAHSIPSLVTRMFWLSAMLAASAPQRPKSWTGSSRTHWATHSIKSSNHELTTYWYVHEERGHVQDPSGDWDPLLSGAPVAKSVRVLSSVLPTGQKRQYLFQFEAASPPFRPPPLVAEGRQIYGRGVSVSGVMHPSPRHRRLVSSRLAIHACT